MSVSVRPPSPAQSPGPAGGLQGSGPGPGPGSAAEDHGPVGQPTGSSGSTGPSQWGPDALTRPCLCLQYVWERMMGGFKHKNSRTREGLCFCLISTLNMWVDDLWPLDGAVRSWNIWPLTSAACYRFGSQSLTLNKIVPHICSLLGDPTSQVRPYTGSTGSTGSSSASVCSFSPDQL